MTILYGLKAKITQNRDLIENALEMNKAIKTENEKIEAENVELKKQEKPLKSLRPLLDPKPIKEFRITFETYKQMLTEEYSITVVPETAIPIIIDERAGSGFTVEYEEE